MKIFTASSFALLLLSALSTSAQFAEYDILKGSTLVSMKGQTDVYEVNYEGKKYDFAITIRENSAEKGIIFDYVMSNEQQTTGTVYIPEAARQTAHAQQNYFNDGEMKLANKTTVWVSNAVFDELEKSGESTISTDGGNTWTVIRRKYYNYDFAVKFGKKTRKDIGYMYCESDDGKAKYWIQTGGNPMILKMDLGWTITLKEYMMPK